MIIAIDFDGTIVEHRYPAIGELIPDAKKYINELWDDGHYIIIWTCRYVKKDLDSMIKFLRENKITYHKINCNTDDLPFDPFPKIYADVYIDDKQIGGLPLWKEIYNIISEMEYNILSGRS